MLVASDEATAGSVIRKAERISPASSGLQPLVLLLRRAVAVEDFHVAGVGRGAVEHLRCQGHAAHQLGARRIFEVGQSGAVKSPSSCVGGRRHEEIPQAFGFGLGLQLFEDRDDLPALTFMVLTVVGFDRRIDMGFHESDNPVAPELLPLRYRKIHDLSLPDVARPYQRAGNSAMLEPPGLPRYRKREGAEICR